jgi:hypothetical protein
MTSRVLRSLCLLACAVLVATLAAQGQASTAQPFDTNLIQNSDFRTRNGNQPARFTLTGDAEYRDLENPSREMSSGWGVMLKSAGSHGGGAVAQTVGNIDAKAGRWYRFTFRGLPQANFAVREGGFWAKAEYFADQGKTEIDGKIKRLDGIVDLARQKLSANGDQHVGGAVVWQTYQFDFYLPFPEVDTVRLSVGFDHPTPRATTYASFLLTDWNLKRLEVAGPAPQEPTAAPSSNQPPPGRLIPLGGRWFYLEKNGETQPAAHVDFRNANQLLYHDDQWSAPFTGEMTSWLRAGEKDINGNIAMLDSPVADNVTIDIDQTSLIIHSRGLPNHPTGRFPESSSGPKGGRRGNPSYIQEQQNTFYIPLDPKVNPRHFVTATDNSNRALPMGPIGTAMNGIAFFNPFDAQSTDASNLMDYCCGHPNQDGLYHYHKYPICMNSPWADEGAAHSPVIGFAFDGFPIYGPFESAGVLAKDLTGQQALNDFNLHWDKDRGWHYHVTPGKFPYVIGGYWGTEDSRDSQRPRHPRGAMGLGGPADGSPDGPPESLPGR